MEDSNLMHSALVSSGSIYPSNVKHGLRHSCEPIHTLKIWTGTRKAQTCVAGRADFGLGQALLIALAVAKVSDLHQRLGAAVQQCVLQFDVPICHTHLVAVVCTCNSLDDYFPSPLSPACDLMLPNLLVSYLLVMMICLNISSLT